jgi:hypothetical protein
MNLTPDLQKKLIAVGAFVLVAGGVLYFELRDDSPPPVAPVVATVATKSPTVSTKGTVIAVPPGNVVGGEAKRVGVASAQLDPTLKMGPMLVTESLVYTGSGRNIFSMNSAPVVIPKPIAPARPKGPVGPVYVAPVGPPPPPPILLKFFGTETGASGVRQAFLLHGEDVVLASAGDIVERRYKVISIAANSIVVEDLTNQNKQTLPLLTN